MAEPEKNEAENAKSDEGGKCFRLLPIAVGLGFEIAIPIVILALAGRYADKALGTSPVLLLAGSLLAVGISMYLIFKKTKELF
jgi:hypothetical protein